MAIDVVLYRLNRLKFKNSYIKMITRIGEGFLQIPFSFFLYLNNPLDSQLGFLFSGKNKWGRAELVSKPARNMRKRINLGL